MKTILLPTDFSECSRNAIAYTLNLFRDEACEFLLLYSCHKSIHFWDAEDSGLADLSQEAKISFAEKKMRRFLQELRQAYPNSLHKYSGKVGEELLLPTIKAYVDRGDLTCIAIGAHGNTHDKNYFFGSNTRNLIEEIRNCPLLVIPGNLKYSPIEEIVLPNDLNSEPDPDELQFLKEIISKTKASLEILHIQIADDNITAREKNQQLLKELLQKEKPEFHFLSGVSVPESIYSFTEDRGSDLLVFIHRKKSFLNNLVMENRKDYSENYFKIPILFIHYD